MSMYISTIPILIVLIPEREMIKNGPHGLLFKVGNKKMAVHVLFVYIIVYVVKSYKHIDINAENIIVYHMGD